MSASKEKRERAGQKAAGEYKKLNEAAEQQKKDQKFKRRAWTVTICIVVVAVFVLLFGTNVLYKNAPAFKAGNTSFSAADYNYYNTSIYQNYYVYYSQTYGEYATMLMPAEDQLREETISMMQNIAIRSEAAKKAGFKISEEGLANIDTQVETLKTYAETYGYEDLNMYFGANYGRGVDEKLFRENMELWILADEYEAHLKESYNYSDAELDAYYDEHKDDFDRISYHAFFISGAETVANEETGTEAVDAETAMKNAVEQADKMVAEIEKGGDFTKVAYEYANEASKSYYETENATLSTGNRQSMVEAYADWLYDSARKEGDTASFEVEGTGCYVVQYVSRSDNSYDLVNVSPDEVNSEDYESDEQYQEALEIAKEAAEANAKDLYEEWKSGEATEESFAEMAIAYSDDTAEGGLYEDVYQGRMTQEFNDWCFDPSRKPGDTAIVETELYGYHIMYFVVYGEPYSRYTARNEYTAETYEAWRDEQSGAFEMKETFMVPRADLFKVMR